MKKVKFIGNEKNSHYQNLNTDSIYSVVRHIPDRQEFWSMICIIVDGVESEHYLYDNINNLLFIDATIEYRDNLIDSILN